MTFGLTNTTASEHSMSIISTKAAQSNPSVSRMGKDANAPTRAQPFSRQPTAAEVLSSGMATGTAHEAAAATAGQTPFKAFAAEVCGAGEKLRLQLEKNGIRNPAYLGSDRGSFVFSNAETGEMVVRHTRLKTGLFDLQKAGNDSPSQKDKLLNIQNVGNLCQVKKDGRIILNGETITKAHPDHARVMRALDDIVKKISSNTLDRFGGLHSASDSPWLADAPDHSKYVD